MAAPGPGWRRQGPYVPPSKGPGLAAVPGGRGPCLAFRKGKCAVGRKCKFSHDPASWGGSLDGSWGGQGANEALEGLWKDPRSY